MNKYLIGCCVINRHQTANRVINALIRLTPSDRFRLFIIDQNSDQTTKFMLQEYEDRATIIHNEWNIGVAFGVNQYLSKRLPGEHCIILDSDAIIDTENWLDIVDEVIVDKDIGVIAGRRPTAWIDSGMDKINFFRTSIITEKRHDQWCEVSRNNLIITGLMVLKNTVLDTIGYQNEATGYDDLDYCYRINKMGLISCYIPDIVIRQPIDEPNTHPQYGSHKALMLKTLMFHRKYVSQYLQGKSLYMGTRFLPETMQDEEYRKMSNENWEFLRTWRQ